MSGAKKKRTNAVDVLHKRYIGDDPNRKASMESERVNAQVARTIHDLRTEANLTQKDLAELIGTTRSVISRLEDADYDGHSLSMLSRIAEALNQRVTVLMTADDPEVNTVRYVFREVVRGLRRLSGLTIAALAEKLDLDQNEIVAMERSSGYRPSPFTLHKLSRFYKIPQEKILMLAGATRNIPKYFEDEASKFAANSDSFSKLTDEEKRVLDSFVCFLRDEKNEVTGNGLQHQERNR